MAKQWIVAALVLLMAAAAIVQQGRQPSDPAHAEQLPKVGFRAPSFQLTDLDGNVFVLDDVLGNKPVVVNFWASWCGPCRIEAPELVKLYEQYGGDIEVAAVNLTADDSERDAAQFAAMHGFAFPTLLDHDGGVRSLYRAKAVPTTFFVRRDGTIQDVVIGVAAPSVLQDKFRKLLP